MEQRLMAILRFMLEHHSEKILIEKDEIFLHTGFGYAKIKAQDEDYKLLRYLEYLAGWNFSKPGDPQKETFCLQVDGMDRWFSFEGSINKEQGILTLIDHV